MYIFRFFISIKDASVIQYPFLRFTSTMQLFAGDYIAQDVSVGFPRFLPAELQRIRT